jgi:glycosyltransferase involved in cell wall biosynthesis
MQADLPTWFHPRPEGYLAFLGRMSPEKGPDRAIEIAKRLGMPLKMAAKVDPHDSVFFREVITPMLDHPLIEYIGEIGDAQKPDFLGNAAALLFPIDWPEPFGLAMIEALACGTPVIARPCGSVPEIITPGVDGFVASGLDGLVAAVDRVDSISREQCRRTFQNRFTVEKMVDAYEAIYRAIIEQRSSRALALLPNRLPEKLLDGMSSVEKTNGWTGADQTEMDES